MTVTSPCGIDPVEDGRGHKARKRYRAPTAEPGEIKIVYGRADRHSRPDICVAWGDGSDMKCSARMVMNALDSKRLARKFPSMEIEYGPSVLEELEARGFDLTTLRCTIQRPTPLASPTHNQKKDKSHD